jgi:uncharacterized membrane protein
MLVCNFWEVHFIAVIMPIFFWELTGIDFIDVIFGKMADFLFAESCLSIAHNTKSDRGQRKTWRLIEPK